MPQEGTRAIMALSSSISRGRSLKRLARYRVGVPPRAAGRLIENDVALADRGLPCPDGRDGRRVNQISPPGPPRYGGSNTSRSVQALSTAIFPHLSRNKPASSMA